MKFNNKFSERLRELRILNTMLQRELGEKLGFSANAVSDWERGKEPDYDTLCAIAKLFDVSLDYLLGLEDL